jgi:RNA polymerase sigma factor (sigma-70 family)
MSSYALAAGVRLLRERLAPHGCHEDSDARLLHAFLSCHDESAFTVLVHRHGPMVLQVCRRVLGHEQDAEDAFQAVFLVLARKAAMVRKQGSLASFLHGVAYRAALKAKQAAARRRQHEGQAPQRRPTDPVDNLSWREVRALLDEAIAQLPQKYRSVFILCCLEGVSREEAARRLGLKEGTLSSRLATARLRLQNQLAQRGVELTALLAAAALAPEPAAALSAPLVAKISEAAIRTALGETLAATVSAPVAALVSSTVRTLSLGKAKLTILLLVLASLFTAGAGVVTQYLLAAPQPQPQQPPMAQTPAPSAPTLLGAEPKPPTPNNPDETTGPLTVHGRVLGPDTRPVAGARLYVPRVQKDWHGLDKELAFVEHGVTDSQGRFQLELSAADRRAAQSSPLIAAAESYGVDGAELPRGQSAVELTLRLPVDSPIHGQIVSTEGRPLPGIQVRVLELATTREERLDGYLTLLKHTGHILGSSFITKRLYLPAGGGRLTVLTDANGRFQIHGAGRERVAVLQVNGRGIAQGLVRVINRPGLNVESYQRGLVDRSRPEDRGHDYPQRHYGPTLVYVADPAQAIEGVIREEGSGRPVAGVRVSSMVNTFNYAHAVSDAQGRYRLEGLAKRNPYWLRIEPPDQGPWLQTVAEIPDAEGWQTLHADLELARGVVVTGQVRDRATGKGVPSGVRYVPLLGNVYFGKNPGYDLYRYQEGQLSIPTDAEGHFRLVVIPGLSALVAEAANVEHTSDGLVLNPYKAAEFDQTDRPRVTLRKSVEGNAFLTAGKSPGTANEYLSNLNAVKVLDLAEGASPVTYDLSVERGKTLTVHIQDPEGKPLSGAVLAGLTATGWDTFPLKEASTTIYALDPKGPRQLGFLNPGRQLGFFHRDRQLAGTLTVRGDEPQPPTARLVPTGVVLGRVLDGAGQPLAGVEVSLGFSNYGIGGLSMYLELQRDPLRTDKEGRFRRDGVFPNQWFRLDFRRGHTPIFSELRLRSGVVKPGATLDLGDIPLTPVSGLGDGQQPAKPSATSGARAQPQATESSALPAVLTYVGRVLNPDGKPLAGAKVYICGLTPGVIEFRKRTVSGADGGFRFTVRREEFGNNGVVPPSRSPPERFVFLGATAEGCGSVSEMVHTTEQRDNVTLWLPAEEMVHGRILSSEGKPVPGVKVGASLWGGRADKDHRPLPSDTAPQSGQFYIQVVPDDAVRTVATTDKDGNVTMRGLSRGWAYRLFISGPTIVNARAFLIARPQKATVVPAAGVHSPRRPPPQLPQYGSTFTHIVLPSKPIQGVVRDRNSNRPLAGVHVEIPFTRDDDPQAWATTNQEGRYRLTGLPPAVHTLRVTPVANIPYLATEVRVQADQPGIEPVSFDISLERRPAVIGRVTDQATGKPVKAWVEYRPLARNPHLKENAVLASPGLFRPYQPTVATDAEGQFLLPVLEGPGVLLVRAETDYLPAKLAPADQRAGIADASDPELIDCRPSPAWPEESHAYRLIDVAKGSDASVEIMLAPGVRRPLILEFPDGKPHGTTVLGLRAPVQDHGSQYYPENKPLVILQEGETRRLYVCTHDGAFAVSTLVRAQERGPIKVRLKPTGTVSGRVLDQAGKPIRGVSFQMFFEDSPGRPDVFVHSGTVERLLTPVESKRKSRTTGFMEYKLFRYSTAAQTDDQGRFRLSGLLPEVPFDLKVHLLSEPDAKDRRSIVAAVSIARPTVQPGETLNLGDLRAVQPPAQGKSLERSQ